MSIAVGCAGISPLPLAERVGVCLDSQHAYRPSNARATSPASVEGRDDATLLKLVLSLAPRCRYVDSYYGPPELARRENLLKEIASRATTLREEMRAVTPELRQEYLRRQTSALIARTEMLRGRKLTFDEESSALYDAVAPHNSEELFEGVNAKLEREVPGGGPLTDRVEAFRMRFAIPREKLDDVFNAAIRSCRAMTNSTGSSLPARASPSIRDNKAWSGSLVPGNFRA